MDLMFPDSYEVNDGAQPEFLALYRNAVTFAHNTIFQEKPQRSGYWIFREPQLPHVNIYSESLSYIVNYKTDRNEDSKLVMTYLKENDGLIQVVMIHTYSSSDGISFAPHQRQHGLSESNRRISMNNSEDFLYVFKRWLYLDHNVNNQYFFKNIQLIFKELNDQKAYEKHRSGQVLDIMRQARKNQNIHDVWRNEDLTNQIVRAGFVNRV